MTYVISLEKYITQPNSIEETRIHRSRGPIIKKSLSQRRQEDKEPWPESCTLYILHNFNNTLVTVTNTLNGHTVIWVSAGTCQFKNARKRSVYAAKIILGRIIKKILKKKVERLNIIISGFSWSKTPTKYFVRGLLCIKRIRRKKRRNREKRKRVISSDPIFIKLIRDVTPFPHNGCRPRKRRRKKVRTRRRFRKIPRHPKTWLNLKDRLRRKKIVFAGRKKAKRRKKRPKVRILEAVEFIKEFYRE